MATITILQAWFDTLTDDKDRGDGISESFLQGTKILGSNQSWGQALIFRNNAHDNGQPFDVSAYGLTEADIPSIRYNYRMDNQDGWHVRFRIKASMSDGTQREVANEERKIGQHRGGVFPSVGNGWDEPIAADINLHL